MRRWDSSYNVGLAWLRPIMHSYGECLNGLRWFWREDVLGSAGKPVMPVMHLAGYFVK